MGNDFWFLTGMGVLVFLCYAGSGLHNYLSNKHKQRIIKRDKKDDKPFPYYYEYTEKGKP